MKSLRKNARTTAEEDGFSRGPKQPHLSFAFLRASVAPWCKDLGFGFALTCSFDQAAPRPVSAIIESSGLFKTL
jgi:hypothetical protein